MSTRPAIHLILPLAMALVLSAPPSRAELTAWDQADATALAKELETAAHALHDAFAKKPPPSVGSTQSQAYYRLKQEVRVLRGEARELAASLEKGEGREQTLPIYDHLMQLVRIARDDAAKTFNTQDVGERAAAVRRVLNQLGPYYDPDFRALAPHPNIEPRFAGAELAWDQEYVEGLAQDLIDPLETLRADLESRPPVPGKEAARAAVMDVVERLRLRAKELAQRLAGGAGRAETVALFREVEALQSEAAKRTLEYPAPFDMHIYVDRVRGTTIQLALYYGESSSSRDESRR